MSFESPASDQEDTLKREIRRETPARFRLAVEAMLRANFRHIEVRGEENLDKLPPDAKVIFATTHISDFDVLVPIAKLGRRFRIKAVNASLQHEMKQDALSNIGLRAAGKENTIPVDYKWGKHPQAGKSYYTLPFNSENFTPMKKALEEGDAIVIAAHNPSPVKDGRLPGKGGYGAVYLAEISDAIIVPIAVNVKSEDPNVGVRKSPFKALANRPEAEMIIGEPFKPGHISGIEHLPELLKQRGAEVKDPGTVGKLREVQQALREQSDKVMISLARALPEERRGEWEKKLEESKS